MDEMKASRNQFTFYRSFYNAALNLSKAKRLGFYEAMIRYALDEIMPDTSDSVILAMFTIVKPTLDSARKKAGAGSRGGKASKQKTDECESKDDFASTDDESKDEFASADDASNIEKEKEKENKNNNNININKKKKIEIENKEEEEGKCPSGARWTPLKEGEGAPQGTKWNAFNQYAFGTYGHVLMKIGEYYRLVISLGDHEAQNCISFTDWQAEQGLIEKCSDWAEEVRRCSAENRYRNYLREGSI